jgi:replicative DNA helicase
MMIDKTALATGMELLHEDSFYKSSHRKIFGALFALYEKDGVADAVTVTEELQRRKQLEDVGGAYYVSTLIDSVATAANIEYHIKIVKEKALLRRLIAAATEIASQGYDASEPADEILDKAQQMIFELSEAKISKGFIPIRDLIKSSFAYIESISSKKESATGVQTGFVDFDELTTGLQPADLVVVAGRPSMGKTAFALNIAENAAIEHGLSVGVFSLEMSRSQVVQRMLCSQARVDGHAVRKGMIKQEWWKRLTDAAGRLSDAEIYIDDSPAPSVLEMRAKARRLKAETNLSMVIVDYLQLVRGHAFAENRQQEISQISRALKGLAKELDIPVMALSQLSRAVESRSRDHKPILSDLRESGAIEQDADLVVFVYRPAQYPHLRTEENLGEAQLIIGKQRNGPTGEVMLSFSSSSARFDNWTGRTEGF